MRSRSPFKWAATNAEIDYKKSRKSYRYGAGTKKIWNKSDPIEKLSNFYEKKSKNWSDDFEGTNNSLENQSMFDSGDLLIYFKVWTYLCALVTFFTTRELPRSSQMISHFSNGHFHLSEINFTVLLMYFSYGSKMMNYLVISRDITRYPHGNESIIKLLNKKVRRAHR